ncbi:g6502 [Coccomyxa elongata]
MPETSQFDAVGTSGTQPNTDASPSERVRTACAYGNYEQLTAAVEEDPDLLSTPDEMGYYPLQWAALNNRVGIIAYLIDKGVNVNRADGTGQTALHWAAVRGSLLAAEALLGNEADLRLRDGRGYTACHVAAQYGQTAFIYMVALRWRADVDSPDVDGRTPLHWAAYKGYANTLRLLIVLEASLTLGDREGCTPLHWAAIRGNSEACTVLLQAGAGSVLNAPDSTGMVPAQLAREKGHRFLAHYLEEYASRHVNKSRHWTQRAAVSWLLNTQLCPLIWALILGLLAALVYKVVLHPAYGPPSSAMLAWTWICVLLASAGLVLLYKTTTSDPGFLPCRDSEQQSKGKDENGPQYDRLKALDSAVLRAGNWNQLCVTCKIVRPLRAKHCAVTNRCVAMFDHFCPWVGNCIGAGNRHLFALFLWLEMGAILVAAGLAAARLRWGGQNMGEGAMTWTAVFLVVDVFLGLSVGALSVTQAMQIAKNTTTNEMANWTRYKYLHGDDGTFRNPFNRGCWQNCSEAMCGKSGTAVQLHPESIELTSLLKMEEGQNTNGLPYRQ